MKLHKQPYVGCSCIVLSLHSYSAVWKVELRLLITSSITLTLIRWARLHYLCLREVFSSVHHMFTSLINRSAGQSWREFGPSSDAQPPSFNTYIPSHKEHIPHSSCRKDTHLPLSQIPAMFSGNVALGFCVPPLRRPRPPLTKAKTLQIIEGADSEVFLLTPDRYCWAIIKMLMEETELCDTAGIARVSEVHTFMSGPCYISYVLTSRIVEYSLRATITLDQNRFKTKQKTHRGDSDTINSSVRYVGDTQVQNEAWRGGLRRGDAYEILHSSQLYQADMRRCQRGRPRLLWYGSLLSPQMNPAGSDLATVRQLQHKAHSL